MKLSDTAERITKGSKKVKGNRRKKREQWK